MTKTEKAPPRPASGRPPKVEERPDKAKSLNDKGQSLEQNTRNQGYQQDR